METRQQPPLRQPFDKAQGRQAAPKHPAAKRPMAEADRPGVTVRVSVLEDRADEEEKEAGYGHGV